jgi:hypothetical protein
MYVNLEKKFAIMKFREISDGKIPNPSYLLLPPVPVKSHCGSLSSQNTTAFK